MSQSGIKMMNCRILIMFQRYFRDTPSMILVAKLEIVKTDIETEEEVPTYSMLSAMSSVSCGGISLFIS